MSRKFITPIALFLLLPVALPALTGCGSGGDSAKVSPIKNAYHEHEFSTDSDLSANPYTSTVVVSLETLEDQPPAQDSHTAGIDIIPYSYPKADTHTFCMEDDNGDPHYMELIDTKGKTAASLAAGECLTVNLEAGNYRNVLHNLGHSREVYFIRNVYTDLDLTTETKLSPAKLLASLTAAAPGVSPLSDTTANRVVLISSNECVDCELMGVDFDNTDLDGVNLTGAMLEGASLVNTNLTGADLERADLTDADLSSATIVSVDLKGATLAGATLDHAELSDSDLQNTWAAVGISSAPSVATCRDDRVAFVRGTDGHLWMKMVSWGGATQSCFNNSANSWVDLGGPIKGEPAAASFEYYGRIGNIPNYGLVVFVRGEDDSLRYKYYNYSDTASSMANSNRTGWSAWQTVGKVGTNLDTSPAVLAVNNYLGAPSFYAAYRGKDGELHYWQKINNSLFVEESVTDIHLSIASMPALLATNGSTTLTAFFLDQDGYINYLGLKGGDPDQPIPTKTSIKAASRPTVFYDTLRGYTYTMYYRTEDGVLGGTTSGNLRRWTTLPVNTYGINTTSAPAAHWLGGSDASLCYRHPSGELAFSSSSGSGVTKFGVPVTNLTTQLQTTLHGASMQGTRMANNTLSSHPDFKTDLSGITVDNSSDLSGQSFFNSNLQGASLTGNQDLGGMDFSYADLSEANLAGAILAGADFSGANLSKSTLTGTDLSDATLENATLSEVGLANSILQGADLSGADLSESTLTGSDLSEAILVNATLTGVDLASTTLQGADLSGADLSCERNSHTAIFGEGADLTVIKSLAGAKINDCSLKKATLTDMDLSGIELQGTQLIEADLEGAILQYAALREANLSYANLKGADLTAAFLETDGLNYQEAKLGNAYMPNANLTSAHLSGVYFSGVHLYGSAATVKHATMEGVNFSNANLTRFDLSSTQLSNSHFENAILVNTNFRNAECTGCYFTNSYLQGADFTGANLSSAYMIGANIAIVHGEFSVERLGDNSQLEHATEAYDATILPYDVTDNTTSCPSGDRGPCEGNKLNALVNAPPACIPSLTHFCPPPKKN